MFSIDLKDVYFHIPVHPESQRYLRFCLYGRFYQYRALCFGLSTAPQVFTRVFALVLEWAQQRSVRLLRYLVIVESRTLLLQHRGLVLQLCRDLGIIVNWEKSDLRPSTRVQYLGMLIDTSLEKVFLSEARLACFREMATSFLLLPSPPACMWQQYWATWLRWSVRPLQWRLKYHWSPMVDNPAFQIPLSLECVEAVCWWLQEDRWVFGVPLRVCPLSLLLHTDASLMGWGAHLLELMASGVGSEEESPLHINILEMKAIVLALAAFLPQLSGQSVVLMSDYATVVAYP